MLRSCSDAERQVAPLPLQSDRDVATLKPLCGAAPDPEENRGTAIGGISQGKDGGVWLELRGRFVYLL
jgi:hypothetical protein